MTRGWLWVYETQLASFWLDDEGILNSISRSPTRTIANTTENFEMVKRITNNQKVPLLIYLSKSGVPDKETRTFVTRELPNVYKAMAMISKSGLGKVIIMADIVTYKQHFSNSILM